MTVLNDCDKTRALLAAAPVIASEIRTIDLQKPIWMRDALFQIRPWPGNTPGSQLTELTMLPQMPEIERGFSKWNQWENNTGCDPCPGPDCSYHETLLGGYGIQRKKVTIMSREFKTEPFCVREIETTQDFEMMIDYTIRNMQAQISFFKETSIGQNILTGLAKKYVVDANGANPNRENPYVYPNVGTAQLSSLNMYLLEFFYEYFRTSMTAVPYEMINNIPVFACSCSQQLLRRMFLDDPSLRQDIRFSGIANDLLTRYNFTNTLGGMFLPATIPFPRRFRLATGEPIEILPWLTGGAVKAEVGSYSDRNPNYFPGNGANSATHEEVLFYGMYPFSIYVRNNATTIGANTDFGPEPSFFDYWEWINIQTQQDYFRRQGFFATAGTIGISQQYSEDIYGVLVELPSVKRMATYQPSPVCPPTTEECTNVIPAQGCPCPLVLTSTPNPLGNGQQFITFAVPLDVAAEDVVQLGMTNGGYVNATVVAISEDGKAISATFPEGVSFPCNQFTTVFCDNTLGCSSQVEKWAVVSGDATRLTLILRNPIKADTAADVVTLRYENCTTQSATVVSVNLVTNTWVVDVGGTAFNPAVGAVTDICVPTATDATCAACFTDPVFTQCAT